MSVEDSFQGRDWHGNPPVTTDQLDELVAWSPVILPDEFIAFLRTSDGGEGSFTCYPSYVRIWPAKTVIKDNTDCEIQVNLPGFIGFGDNGGPDFVAFDTRHGAPFPIRAISYANKDVEYAIDVADDFGQFIRCLKPRAGGI